MAHLSILKSAPGGVYGLCHEGSAAHATEGDIERAMEHAIQAVWSMPWHRVIT